MSSTKQHFQLHFQPEHFVLYQEINLSWRRSPWKDIYKSKTKRIQYNSNEYKNYIIIDIDHDNFEIYKEKNLPKPNLIVKNKNKVGCHYFYFLDKTINSNSFYTKLWKETFNYFSKIFEGDANFVGYIGKSMGNKIDFTNIELEEYPYNIKYLSSFIEYNNLYLYEKRSNETKSLLDTHEGYLEVKGRNVYLFNELRVFSYQEIKKSTNEKDFYTIIENKGIEINDNLITPLDIKEMYGVVNSIFRYCIKNKSKIINHKNKKIMNLDQSMSIKEKQALGAKYTNTIQKNKTELKIKVSIMEMKKQGLKITMYSISKFTKLSPHTIKKYDHLLK